jgi:hypothetical protein
MGSEKSQAPLRKRRVRLMQHRGDQIDIVGGPRISIRDLLLGAVRNANAALEIVVCVD